jgi:hypothetical protein
MDYNNKKLFEVLRERLRYLSKKLSSTALNIDIFSRNHCSKKEIEEFGKKKRILEEMEYLRIELRRFSYFYDKDELVYKLPKLAEKIASKLIPEKDHEAIFGDLQQTYTRKVEELGLDKANSKWLKNEIKNFFWMKVKSSITNFIEKFKIR